jgi:hypothetical protein
MRKATAVRAIRRLFLASLIAGLGTVAGAQTRHDLVAGLDFDRWRVCRAAGDVTTVVMDGDGDTDLDLFVYDENGNRIVSDTRSSDYGEVRWRALWSACFEVRVVNLGLVPNLYRISVE